MYLFSLLCCGCLACADSPDWFVSDDDIGELLSREVEYRAFKLSFNYCVLLVCLALLERLTDAEKNLETIGKSEVNFLLEDFWSLVVLFATLRVAKDNILRTC